MKMKTVTKIIEEETNGNKRHKRRISISTIREIHDRCVKLYEKKRDSA